MRTLLTGASGFLGRTLLPRLKAAGHQVLAPSHAEADLEAPSLQLPEAEGVVHLAPTSPASVEALAAWAKAAGAKAFVLASSGNARMPPPEDLYGRWKQLSEQALLKAGLTRAVALRFHTLFGPGDPPGRLIGRLRAADGTVEVASPDGVRLTPTHVEEAAEAVVRVLASDVSGVFDVAGPETLTVGAIARRLGKTVVPRPRLPGERDLAGNPGPLFQAIGFRPGRRLT